MELNRIDIALLTADQLATYGEIAGLYGRGMEARKVPLDMIYVRNGFNHRWDFGDIRALADYLLAGGTVPPIVVDFLKDGRAVLLEGERRVRAHKLLVSEGHNQFNTIQAFRSPATLSEQERVIKSVASNNNKQFSALELAESFKDLQQIYGMSNADIARATGHNVMHVSNQLRLAGISDEEKDLIKDGKVSSTAVLDLIKTGLPPGARLDAVKEASGSDGKGKLKVKDVPIMGDLQAKQLDKDDTPDSIIKAILIHVKALDRLIGTDSKMSDITFKIDAELRSLKTLVTTKYQRIAESSIQTNYPPMSSNKEIKAPVVYKLKDVDPFFAEAARALITNNYTGTGLKNYLTIQIGFERTQILMAQLAQFKIISPYNGNEQHRLFDDLNELASHIYLLKLMSEEDDQPF